MGHKNGRNRNTLVQFLLTLIAIPLLYVFGFGLLALVAITLPYRLFVYIMAKTFRSNVTGFVDGESAAMSTDSLHTKCGLNLILFMVLDDVISTSKFRKMFQDRIINKKDPQSGDLVYGKFQQHWENIMGYNMWRWDTDFNIENHIKPSLGSYTRKDLPKLMSDFLEQPFKRGQSPWEIILIHNYREDSGDGPTGEIGRGKMVVVSRVHHALADGYSLVNVFMRDLQNKLKPLTIPYPNPVKPSWWKTMALLHLFARDYVNMFIDGYDPKNTWIYPLNSASNPLQGNYFTSVTSGILVSQVSAIKNKYKVSYLAVLVHCILQGVRQTLEKEARSVPDQILLKFTRAKPHHPEGLTNHAYLTGVSLPMAKMSTESSLQDIEAEIKKERLSMIPIGFDILIKISSLLPSSLIYFLVTNMLPPGFTCTSFPVPKDVTSFDGVNLTDLFAMVGTSHSQRTLIIAAVGDGGKQNIIASVDQSSYSSQAAFEKLGDYIKDEFNYLLETLQDK